MRKYKLDKEEQEILSSIDKVEWKSVENLQSEIEKYVKYAKNTLKKNQIKWNRRRIKIK